MELLENSRGHYNFLCGGLPYSSGVVAHPGYEVVDVRFGRPLPLSDGFAVADRFLNESSVPVFALCSVTLRSPSPASFVDFRSFNKGYVEHLAARDLFCGDENPIARTNVVPLIGSPSEPVMVAFGYVRPSSVPESGLTFITAGGAELVGARLEPQSIVRPGEDSPEAMHEKTRFVVGVMRERVDSLGGVPSSSDVVNVYTAKPLWDLLPVILEEFPAAALGGIRWVYARPPIDGLEFEMDVRCPRAEVHLEV